MAKRIPALALIILLTSSTALTGQAHSRQPGNDAATGEINIKPHHKDDQSKERNAGSTDRMTKDRKKIRHDAKPAPSKEEQEFERTLLGIFG
jgi:hypothetical protein